MTGSSHNVLINNRYDLVRVVGRGSTGTVYLAYDTHLDRQVAIKILNHKAADNPEIIARFEREISLTARLQHPGVVAVFERALSSDKLPCCVMALAFGQTLEEYITHLANHPDHWTEATLVDRLTLFLKVLDVICYAHSQGVVHRDLKPANIVLGEYGEVHILDWGLARTLDVDEEFESLDHFDDVFGEQGGAAVALEQRPTMGSSGPGVGGINETAAESTSLGAADTVIGNTTGATSEVVPAVGRHSERRSLRLSEQPEPGSDAAARAREEDYAPDDLDESGSLRRGSDGITAADRRSALSDQAARETVVPEASGTGTSARSQIGTARSARRRRAHSSQYQRTGRHSSIPDEGRSTRFGDVLGSPVYMSPEQARGEANIADERADIYALGVILVELLALHPPLEQREDELLLQFIERVRRHEGWRGLQQLWLESPKSLQQITNQALSYHAVERFENCETFRNEVSQVLDQLSASFSELERQRLEREREGAWLPVGRWNYLVQTDIAPFSETVTAYEGEPVGQVLHPEMGGLLVGGCGMQVYPISINVTDDVRLRMDFSITGGSEFWIFMRGVPPTNAYGFRVGAWNGRWLSIVQSHGLEQLLAPDALTMRPIRASDGSTRFAGRENIRRRRIIIEVVGSTLSMTLDDEALNYHDPCPLLGPEHQQIGVATVDSQLIIHEISVERRRSPLMVPSYHIANELLRQQLYPQAITFFQRFLGEHREDLSLATEAHFMLCLAFLRAGYGEQAERELHRFIMEHIDSSLAQDAIHELAALRVGESSNIGPGARVVLSYQETADQSRSRFCMWAVHVLSDAIREDGITADIEESLQLLKHLIRGFSDEHLLLETASYLLSRPMQAFAIKLFDLQAFEDLYRFQQRIQACRNQGFAIRLPALHTPTEYIDTARQLRSLQRDDDLDRKLIADIFRQYRSVRDLISLSSYGCSQELVHYMAEADVARPSLKLLQAGLLARNGHEEEARECLEYCFALMDKIESERTDIEIATISRLAMFALGYLPWEVAWEPIAVLSNNADLQAMASWIAESFGHREAAIEAYRLLHSSIGSGFRMVAEQGLARLNMQSDLR